MKGPTQTPPNQPLELSIPDAAQSVADAPLCLLSGLAAQWHVRNDWHVHIGHQR